MFSAVVIMKVKGQSSGRLLWYCLHYSEKSGKYTSFVHCIFYVSSAFICIGL